MGNQIVAQNHDTGNTQTVNTKALTATMDATRKTVMDMVRVRGADVVAHPGYMDIFVAGEHVGRWLQRQELLWYKPRNPTPQPQDDQDPTELGGGGGERVIDPIWPIPPRCGECGAEMRLEFQNGTADPFWSCRNFYRPYPGRCEGRQPFKPHPEDEMRAGESYYMAVTYSLQRLQPLLAEREERRRDSARRKRRQWLTNNYHPDTVKAALDPQVELTERLRQNIGTLGGDATT